MATTDMESLVRRDRRIVLTCLVGITVLAWIFLVDMAIDMGGDVSGSVGDGASLGGMFRGDAVAKPRAVTWGSVEFAIAFAMWAAMMMAMMLPTASPMVLMFATINRNQRREDDAIVPTGVFVAGYIAIWVTFALAATLLQWGFQSVGLISPMMGKANAVFGGLVLFAAGIYQWTPLKDACLRLCQTPLGFLMTRWRDGAVGAFRMGLSHGAFCVGCCWALMLLMFAGGVMNLFWMALLTVFMLAEKIVPPGPWLPRAAGTILIMWGGWVLGAAS